MNAKDVSEFEYVELSKSGISDDVINNFDCGNQDMSDYLHLQAKTDAAQSKCVTYVLVDSTKSRIYAYSTISSYAMYYYELADKFHTKPMTDDGNVLVTIPAVEIKMFAIDTTFFNASSVRTVARQFSKVRLFIDICSSSKASV